VHAVHIKVMGRDIDTGIPQCILLPSDEIHSAAQRIT
jgi:actin-like ATPase involved in cell morphogenesis